VAAESEDPSFLAVHPSGKYLYAVNEIDHFGAQKAARRAPSHRPKTGKLTLLNQAARAVPVLATFRWTSPENSL